MQQDPRGTDVLNIAGLLLDGAADVARFERFLAEFTVMCGANKGTFGVADLTAQRIGFCVDVGLSPAAYDTYAPFIPTDPTQWYNYGEGRAHAWPDGFGPDEIEFLAQGGVYLSTTLCPAVSAVATDLVEQHLRPNDIAVEIVVGSRTLSTGDMCAIALGRGFDDPPLTTRHAELANVAAPLVYSAADTHLQFHRLKFEASLARQALDDLGFGLAFLDDTARVVFANRAFNTFAEQAEALRLQAGRLRCLDDGAQAAFLAELRAAHERAAAGAHDFGQPLRLPRRDRNGNLTAFLSTLNPVLDDPFYDTHLRPYALIVVTDPARALDVAPPRLMKLFDVTRAEAQVLALLTAGATLEDITARLHVADSTVRSHIKRLLAKLGVNRQADLLRLVLQSPLTALSESVLTNEARVARGVEEVAAAADIEREP